MAAVIRPPSASDAEAVAALINDVTGTWFGWPETSPAAVSAWWTAPTPDGESNARVAVEEEGRISGYAVLQTGNRELTQLWGEIRAPAATVASPIGPGLAKALETRADELASRALAGSSVVLRVSVEGNEHVLEELLRIRGYRAVRHSERLAIDLHEPPPTPDWPKGISVRPFRRGEDERIVYDLQMETFADTWDFVRDPYDRWLQTVFGTNFDPSLWLVAESGKEVAGFLISGLDSSQPDVGWMHLIGVRRPWRGQGLGLALTLETLQGYRERGIYVVGCGVDADNPMGAARLCRLAGFGVAQTFTTYELELRRERPVLRLLARSRRRLRRVLARRPR